MSVIAQGFVGARLAEARMALGLSATTFADLVDLSVQSVSKYENDRQAPKLENVHRFAVILKVPYDYFFRPKDSRDAKPIFWRARLSAPPAARDRAGVRLEWMKEIVEYLEAFFDLPTLNVPRFPFSEENFGNSGFIERVASKIREFWNIRPGPMPDAIEQLETNGILVSRIHVRADKLDAFSQWSDRFNIPFVILSRDKASACRQRFDVLHELVHITCHTDIAPKRLSDERIYRELERQADQIASAILLPEAEFVGELYAPTLDGFLTLKERWGVSVAAMIMRSRQLDLIDDDEARRLWINYNRRGWRTSEPLDGKLKKEEPHLIRRSFELLIQEGVQTAAQIVRALPFPIGDLEELADLEPGVLSGAAPNRPEPILKDEYRTPSNVVSIFQKKR